MKGSTPPNVYLSDIDEERFDIRAARAPHITVDTLPSVLDFCRANAVIFLIARCPTDDMAAVHAMEQEGFHLMDTLVFYSRKLTEIPVLRDTTTMTIHPFVPGQENDIERVAAESFRGYKGHYHSDARLGRAGCDAVYISWAVRSCVSRKVADEVLVAESNASVAGFITLRLSSPAEGEGPLWAVAPRFQRQGVAGLLMVHAMLWCRLKGAQRMTMSTQVTNLLAQKVWTRMGFEPGHSYYTFHKWFDAP
ncbi:GNAT family N-acetyltransferase [Candidatus Poribacteria bacterium]|nr:GNAT family N-acetyltransferase [Candidatus Poribacteria bacterium]